MTAPVAESCTRSAAGSYYYDNANFRAEARPVRGLRLHRARRPVPSGQFCVKVTPRVNIGQRRLARTSRSATAPRSPSGLRSRLCGPDFTNDLGLLGDQGPLRPGCRCGTSPAAAGSAWSPVRTPPRSPTRPLPAPTSARRRTRYAAGWPTSATRSPLRAGQQAHPADVHQRAGHAAHSLSRHLAASPSGVDAARSHPHPPWSARALRWNSTSGRRAVRPQRGLANHTLRRDPLRKPCGPLGLENPLFAVLRGMVV